MIDLAMFSTTLQGTAVLPIIFVSLAAGIVLALGGVHLLYTFRGTKLLPRDPALQAAMQADSPRISRQTTMWRAWIGFNASHSMGAILFGLVYLHLALWQPRVLLRSTFLCGLGEIYLLGYVVLGWRYWFSVPFRGVVLAALLFMAGLAMQAWA